MIDLAPPTHRATRGGVTATTQQRLRQAGAALKAWRITAGCSIWATILPRTTPIAPELRELGRRQHNWVLRADKRTTNCWRRGSLEEPGDHRPDPQQVAWTRRRTSGWLRVLQAGRLGRGQERWCATTRMIPVSRNDDPRNGYAWARRFNQPARHRVGGARAIGRRRTLLPDPRRRLDVVNLAEDTAPGH